MFDGTPFANFTEFLQMGRYALHVWSVYVLFTVFIIVNLYLPRAQRKQFIREQKSRALRDAQMSGMVDAGSDAALGERV